VDAERGERGEIELEPMLGKRDDAHQLIALADTQTRNGFVRKVYGILGTQLVVTMLLAGTIVRHGRQWLASNPAAMMSVVTMSCFASLVIAAVFACCPDTMRKSPMNYGLMAVFTMAESVLVGVACLQYTLGSVVLCCGLTGMVVLGLTVYATQSKQDFTGIGPYLVCFLLVLFGCGLFMSIAGPLGLATTAAWGYMQMAYAAAGAVVFSFFIVYDTQMIVGGKHQNEFCVDDYAMAAISLYMDVIQLFLALLRLIGRQDDSGI
jgi:FtsH-binding integral membrane protein